MMGKYEECTNKDWVKLFKVARLHLADWDDEGQCVMNSHPKKGGFVACSIKIRGSEVHNF